MVVCSDCLIGSQTANQNTNRPISKTMSKKSYEHQAIESTTSVELIVQTAAPGRAGWEMVSVVYDQQTQKYVAFLKKKIRHGKHHDDDSHD
jgi:hypothetical protein